MLVGILLPTYARNQSENAAYAVASATFFSLQVTFYLFYGLAGLALTGFIIFPAVGNGYYFGAWGATFFFFTIMLGLREVVIRWLWRTAEKRLYFDAKESGIHA